MTATRCGVLAPLVALVVLMTILPGVAAAAPGLMELERSEEPLLVQARSVDLCLQPPEKANQQEAERLFLQFIREHPGHPLIPYLYAHLGQTFSGWANSDFGHVKDDKKAERYFAESVRLHPRDKISSLLVDVWACAAALAPTRQERVEEYIKYYKWLKDMKEDEIADKLWLSEDEKRRMESAPERKEAMLKTFWENRAGAMEVAMHNMVDLAAGGGRDNRQAPQLLDEIATAFPGQAAGQLATEKKKEWFKQHPQLAESSRRGWMFLVWTVNCIVVLAALFAFVWRRRRKA